MMHNLQSNLQHRILMGIVIVLVTAAGALSVGQPAYAACAPLPSGLGTATFNITIPADGTYRFWARMYSPSAGNNSFYLQMADASACQVTVGDAASIPAGTFTWVDYQNAAISNKINLTLTSGAHAVVLAGLDPSVGIDKIMFVADQNCVPTGDGSNCVDVAAAPTPAASSGNTNTNAKVKAQQLLNSDNDQSNWLARLLRIVKQQAAMIIIGAACGVGGLAIGLIAWRTRAHWIARLPWVKWRKAPPPADSGQIKQ